jgi:hypothetical protein
VLNAIKPFAGRGWRAEPAFDAVTAITITPNRIKGIAEPHLPMAAVR